MRRKITYTLVFFSLSVLIIHPPLHCQNNETNIDSLVNDLHNADYYVQMNTIEKLITMGEPAVPHLIDTLNNGNPELRMRAAEALGRIGDRRAIAALTAHLADEDIIVRIYAIGGLGQLRAEEAFKSLLSMLADENWEIRGACTEALGLIGNVKAVPSLIALLEDEQPQVCENAEIALKKITKKDFGHQPARWRQWYDTR